MNANGRIVVVAVVACVALGTLAWRASEARRNAQREREKIAAGRAGVEVRANQLERAERDVAEARAKVEAELAALQARKPAAGEVGGAKQGVAVKDAVAKAALHPNEVLTRDPKLQALSVEAMRARFETTYGPLLRALRLTPEQIARLRAAQSKLEATNQDIVMVMREQKLRGDDPVVTTLREQAAEELRAAQVEVLGEAGHERWRSYERTLPARTIAERFAGAMALGDRPISADQAERLTQIMAESGGLTGRERIDPATINWDDVDRRAADVLTPEQLSSFKRIEPMGGGMSRWMAQFNRALADAGKAMEAGAERGGPQGR